MRQIPWKEWLIRTCLILGSLAIALFISELILRKLRSGPKGTEFASLDEVRRTILQDSGTSDVGGSVDGISSVNLRNIVVPHPNDRIIFELKQNLRTSFQGVPVRTNSCGMRGPERSIVKPSDTIRIALLGDSFAFGWGVEEDKIFAARLERNLNDFAQGTRRVEVLNFGVPGYSTFQEVAKFEETALEFQPDIVLVFFVENDFGYPFFVRNVTGSAGLLAATQFARLTWRAVDPKVEEERLRLLGLDPNRSLARLADLCRARGIKLFITFNPKKGSEKDRKQLWILRDRKDIRPIVFRTEFIEAVTRRQIPEADLRLPTDPHPSAIRHAIYGDVLTPYFMEYVR